MGGENFLSLPFPSTTARFQFSLSPTSLGHNKRPLRRREVPTLSALKVAFCTPAFMSHRISVFSSKVTTKSPLEATTSIRRLLKWLLRRVWITVPKRKDKEVGEINNTKGFSEKLLFKEDGKIIPGQEPMIRSEQIPCTRVTAFSLTRLFLERFWRELRRSFECCKPFSKSYDLKMVFLPF